MNDESTEVECPSCNEPLSNSDVTRQYCGNCGLDLTTVSPSLEE